jgi:dTDP-4-dehydrorhamnose reductase
VARPILGSMGVDRPLKIMVLGASGMAGHVIATHLEDQGHDVTRAAHTRRVTLDTRLVDLRDPAELVRLRPDSYDVVVNAVGILIGDADRDRPRTVMLNSCMPRQLAHMLARTSTQMIHLSTDCVFSGTTGPYTEDSPPDAETFYGRSKELGEVINDKDLTFRQSIIGPDLAPDGAGLFAWFSRQQGPVRGYRGVRWNGVTSLELARCIEAAIGQGLTGLHHVTPPGPITKHDLLTMIGETFGWPITVEPVDEPVNDKTLIDTRRCLAHQPPDYPEMLADLRAWVDNYPGLYPHYRQETR